MFVFVLTLQKQQAELPVYSGAEANAANVQYSAVQPISTSGIPTLEHT